MVQLLYTGITPDTRTRYLGNVKVLPSKAFHESGGKL